MRTVTKQLKFPLLGLKENLNYRDSTAPLDERKYATPRAMNVIGECVFANRLRGGSRPALVSVSPESYEETHPSAIIYRDRLVAYEESVWMLSAVGDYGNFDFGAPGEEPTRAVAGNVNLAGKQGENITSVFAYLDKALFVSTPSRLLVIRGEPTQAAEVLSDRVGVVSSNAWCADADTFYFLGMNGLYVMRDGGAPLLASEQIPRKLKGLDSATLVYDPEYLGIHIFADDEYWFYDINEKAFWPMSYFGVTLRSGVWYYRGDVRSVAFADEDGVLWAWDESAEMEDESYVTLGPFRCGLKDDLDGFLAELSVILGKSSGIVSVGVSTGKSPEDAVVSEITEVARTSDGWNCVVRPRTRGAWACVHLSSNGKWAYESILATTKSLGRLRR